jgi:hypothetical protein
MKLSHAQIVDAVYDSAQPHPLLENTNRAVFRARFSELVFLDCLGNHIYMLVKLLILFTTNF